jgi:hypothetical protein
LLGFLHIFEPVGYYYCSYQFLDCYSSAVGDFLQFVIDFFVKCLHEFGHIDHILSLLHLWTYRYFYRKIYEYFSIYLKIAKYI